MASRFLVALALLAAATGSAAAQASPGDDTGALPPIEPESITRFDRDAADRITAIEFWHLRHPAETVEPTPEVLERIQAMLDADAVRRRALRAELDARTDLTEDERFARFSAIIEDEENELANLLSSSDTGYAGGGRIVAIEMVPFQVQIRYADTVTNATAPGIDDPAVPRWQTRHICGGTLIDRDWVMTAAHCVTPAHVRVGIVVQMGVANISSDEGLAAPVDRLVRHPGYDPRNIYDYDIALLHLKPDRRRRDGRKIRIATTGTLDSERVTPVQATGWGITKGRSGQPVAYLRHIGIYAEPQDVCAAMPGFGPVTTAIGVRPRIHQRVFCAGEIGQKTCPGDSGGPVYRGVDADKMRVVGIISWAKKGCGVAENREPGVYTAVAAYAQWIAGVKRRGR